MKTRFYTMLELVSAVLLIAILSAAAAGRLRPDDGEPDPVLEAEKWRELAASARLRAVSSGETVRVCFRCSDRSLICGDTRLPLPAEAELFLDGEKIGPAEGDEVEIMTVQPDGRGRLHGETILLCGGERVEMRLSLLNGALLTVRETAGEPGAAAIAPEAGNTAAPEPLWRRDEFGEK